MFGHAFKGLIEIFNNVLYKTITRYSVVMFYLENVLCYDRRPLRKWYSLFLQSILIFIEFFHLSSIFLCIKNIVISSNYFIPFSFLSNSIRLRLVFYIVKTSFFNKWWVLQSNFSIRLFKYRILCNLKSIVAKNIDIKSK